MDAYLELPVWLRAMISVGVIVAGVWMTFTGFEGRPNKPRSETSTPARTDEDLTPRQSAAMFRVGIVVSIVGGILVMTTTGSKSEKSGYKF